MALTLARCNKMWYNFFVEWYFKKRFSAYLFPFERSDEKIMQMPDAEKKEYYRQAKDLLENRVFKQEIQEALRKKYQELSLNTANVSDMQAHRLACTFIKDFHTRIQALASLYQPPNITNISERFK